MRAAFPALVTALALGGCAAQPTPSQVYEAYHAHSAEGMTFDEDAAHYTVRKRAEVERRIPALMQRLGVSRDDALRRYLDLSQAVARCKRIELIEQRIDGATAHLRYRQADTCGNASAAQETQRVRMLDEGGWKIDEVEIDV